MFIITNNNNVSTIQIIKNNVTEYQVSFTTDSPTDILKNKFYRFYVALVNDMKVSFGVPLSLNDTTIFLGYDTDIIFKIPSKKMRETGTEIYRLVLTSENKSQICDSIKNYIKSTYINTDEKVFSVEIIDGYSKKIDDNLSDHFLSIYKNSSHFCDVIVKDKTYKYTSNNKLYYLGEKLHQNKKFKFAFDGYVTNDIGKISNYEKLVVTYENDELKFSTITSEVSININDYNRKEICNNLRHINNESWY